MSPGPPIPHPGTSDRPPTSLLKHECPSRQSSSSSQSPEQAPQGLVGVHPSDPSHRGDGGAGGGRVVPPSPPLPPPLLSVSSSGDGS